MDSLVYENGGYTVEFGIISLLTRRDTKKAAIQNWDANGALVFPTVGVCRQLAVAS